MGNVSDPGPRLATAKVRFCQSSHDGQEVASALAPLYADGTFDAVWSDGVLSYTGDMPRALSEIWRVLARAGRPSELPTMLDGASFRAPAWWQSGLMQRS